MSPIKALTMKDYENQITALKKENFNLKLRIYFMEERMQTNNDFVVLFHVYNIELKVELESMKRELAEKQELLVSASKALESLAGRESGEPQRVREQAQREMDMLRELMNKRITDLEQNLQAAEEEIEKMAAIAEQEKLRNINMEKQLQAFSPLSAFPPVPSPTLAQELQQALQEKENIIEQLKIMLKNQEAALHHNNGRDRYDYLIPKKCSSLCGQILSGKLEEMENEVNSDKKNALKRDKTIQGLTQVLREKEKELCHEIEDRDDALAKAREAAHKAQLQKYQGVEEHQNLLMEKQTELAQLQGEHHAKVLEAQKLQRALDRKEQELSDLQQLKDQLETELEDARQQKKKGDKLFFLNIGFLVFLTCFCGIFLMHIL
uniref:Centrosomin N-terminal motif 1 domain-containing protein n=1 Tax=Oryzias melastigma TaxID=30732 RepID=A0A3B3DF90_ORYME